MFDGAHDGEFRQTVWVPAEGGPGIVIRRCGPSVGGAVLVARVATTHQVKRVAVYSSGRHELAERRRTTAGVTGDRHEQALIATVEKP